MRGEVHFKWGGQGGCHWAVTLSRAVNEMREKSVLVEGAAGTEAVGLAGACLVPHMSVLWPPPSGTHVPGPTAGHAGFSRGSVWSSRVLGWGTVGAYAGVCCAVQCVSH